MRDMRENFISTLIRLIISNKSSDKDNFNFELKVVFLFETIVIYVCHIISREKIITYFNNNFKYTL